MCADNLSEETNETTMPIVVQKFINVSLVFTKQKVKISDLSKITSSEAAAAYFRQFYTESEMLLRESLYFMALNRSNRILAVIKHSTGGINGTVCDIRLMFIHLIQLCATGVVICHNHPSGNLEPSHVDKVIGKKIKDIGKLLDIRLLDSIILSDEGYYSMQDEGDL